MTRSEREIPTFGNRVGFICVSALRMGLFYGTHSSFWGYLPTFDPNKNMTCVKYISLKNL